MSATEGQSGDRPGSGSDGVAWLFGLQRFGIRVGLETVRALLARVGDPQASQEVVLVGGTNGKGSVASLLEASLRTAGYRTGLFTSPHLLSATERIRVNGEQVAPETLGGLLAALRPAAEEVGATFFEVVTAAALLRFAQEGVERAVMEVGMGGRLDATNVTSPVLSVITNVALDHTAVLGNDVTEIAGEKAGIMRRGVPTVTGATGEALEALRSRAEILGAPLYALGADFVPVGQRDSWDGVSFGLELAPRLRSRLGAGAGQGFPEGVLNIRSRLVGRHQVDNVAVAVVAALLLGVRPADALAAVAATGWPGRLERLRYGGRTFVLDGAHNPAAAAALAATLRELTPEAAPGAPVVDTMVVGTSNDKDVEGVLSAWVGLSRRMIFTGAARSPRASDPSELERVWREVSQKAGHRTEQAGEVEVTADPAAAIETAVASSVPGAVIVVAGSLFLAAEARGYLLGLEAERFERWQ